MSEVSDSALKAASLVVKNETVRRANDALRVGGLFENMSDSKTNKQDFQKIKKSSLRGLIETEFLTTNANQMSEGIAGYAFTSGTMAMVNAEANHPGIAALTSSVGGTLSGYGVLTQTNIYVIDGGENFLVCFKPVSANATTVLRFGISNITNTNLPTDAIIFSGVGNGTEIVMEGMCRNTSSESVTLTSFNLPLNAWYLADIQVNDTATLVTFTIYNEDGAVLWTSTVDANIPEIPLRVGVLALETTAPAQNIVLMDYFGLQNTRGLYRGELVAPAVVESFFGSQRFFDNFENGVGTWELQGEFNSSFYGFGSAVISTEQASSGTHSLKVVTDGKDGDFYAQSNNFQYDFAANGEDVIVSMKVYFPKRVGFYFVFPEWGFFEFWQIKGVSTDNTTNNPLHALYINNKGVVDAGGEMYIQLGYAGTQWGDGSNPTYIPLQGAGNHLVLPTEQWVDIKVRIKFGDGDGIVQVWQDDVKIFNETGLRTFRNASNIDRLDVAISNYGRYHRCYVGGVWDGLSSITLYADDFKISNTNPLYSY